MHVILSHDTPFEMVQNLMDIFFFIPLYTIGDFSVPFPPCNSTLLIFYLLMGFDYLEMIVGEHNAYASCKTYEQSKRPSTCSVDGGRTKLRPHNNHLESQHLSRGQQNPRVL
jgi:hypothetical protein